MIFHIFWCFNIHLLCAIIWNTDITYDIYHFNHKSQYVVQLKLFYFGNITYICLYILISNCCITYYVKVYCNIFSHIVTCHEPLYNHIAFFPLCSKKLYKKITLIISQIHYSWNITHNTIFYETAPTLYFIYYRCFTTIWCHFSHSVSLKLHMQLVLITFTLFIQWYWL